MGEIADRIREEVGGWPGVRTGPHRFGGTEFRANGHEIGHLHGDRLADLPFPVHMRRDLVESGLAQPHHVLPESGWVSYRIHSPEDVDGALALFRLNYDRITTATSAGYPVESASEPETEVAETVPAELEPGAREPEPV